eukprot:366157-Chlamydomonas_euryale.AAC.22
MALEELHPWNDRGMPSACMRRAVEHPHTLKATAGRGMEHPHMLEATDGGGLSICTLTKCPEVQAAPGSLPNPMFPSRFPTSTLSSFPLHP